jgi:hypothetical protein
LLLLSTLTVGLLVVKSTTVAALVNRRLVLGSASWRVVVGCKRRRRDQSAERSKSTEMQADKTTKREQKENGYRSAGTFEAEAGEANGL